MVFSKKMQVKTRKFMLPADGDFIVLGLFLLNVTNHISLK